MADRALIAKFVKKTATAKKKKKGLRGLKGTGSAIVHHGRPGSALDNQYNDPHGTS